ncbi:MAG: RNA-binding protein [Gomphosphaeria aponina SAG 52.96 = DSM 107014]|uniref:RNA-binding protein n=1 Tax=Gomphosphaeria aponina SAG 52.96 = DSM 107014 TaxID=1521640 RepID=A0A941GS11_9CHRO|nr:RNA-binding protein [Gomphosphaeria aponina SAG 52.96 = DSM 107014]
MTVRIYVGNLPKKPMEREELQTYFADAGESVTTKLIKDRKTGECRGFAFITVENDEIAQAFIDKFNGQDFMGLPLKLEKAQPRAKAKGKDEAPAKPEANSDTPPPTPSRKSKAAKSSSRRQNSGSSSNSEDIQPDPRWADKLSQLKEMLAAQTTNS